jgi:hypothetical protein
MDGDHYPSLQRLTQLSAQLAAISRGASAIETCELDDGERLLHAVAASDWPAVSALSEQLAARFSAQADERLVRVAQKTGAALRRSPNTPKAKRQDKELMAALRETKVGRLAS